MLVCKHKTTAFIDVELDVDRTVFLESEKMMFRIHDAGSRGWLNISCSHHTSLINFYL